MVNVSSSCGHLSKIDGAEPAAAALRAQLSSPQLTVPELEQLMNSFVQLGTYVMAGQCFHILFCGSVFFEHFIRKKNILLHAVIHKNDVGRGEVLI